MPLLFAIAFWATFLGWAIYLSERQVKNMDNKGGKWWLASRGNRPNSWDQFVWEDQPEPDFDTALTKLMLWRSQGQHVRLEWIPDGTYFNGQSPNQ